MLSVSDKAEAYAREVTERLKAEGLRAEADLAADKLGAKIRRAQLEKIPYMVVVGEKDMAARVVSPRTREGAQQPATPLDDFARRLAAEAKVPDLTKTPDPASPTRPRLPTQTRPRFPTRKIPDLGGDPAAPAGITIP